MADYDRVSDNFVMRFNHTISQKTYYELSASYLGESYNHSYENMSPSDYWIITADTMYSTVANNRQDPRTGFYDENSYETPWQIENNTTYSLRFDLTSQVHPEHMIKVGFNADYSDLNNVHIIGGARALSAYGEYLYEDGEEFPLPPGPDPTFAERRWIINGYPLEGAFYVTDKFEKESLVINAGVRMYWFMAGYPTTSDTWKEQWELAAGFKANYPRIKYQVDPRIGVSFPVSTKTSFCFSYGHFNKRAGVDDYIRDPYSGGFTGNPHLDFVKTVKFEFGFSHEFPNKWALDIKNFTSETSGSISSTKIDVEFGLPIHLHDNTGFSRVRGLEFTLRKRRTKYLSGRLTYTLQWAKDYSSSKFEDYRRSLNNFPNPIRERRLGWDRRHDFVLNCSFNVKKGEHPSLFGFKFPDNWTASILSTYRSGRPYTPGTHSPSEKRKLHNTKIRPARYRTDISLEKMFIIKNYQLTVGFDIDNIFDSYNVTSCGFNEWIGEPYKYGDVLQDTDQLYDYYDIFRLLTPDRFGLGRHFEFILELNW